MHIQLIHKRLYTFLLHVVDGSDQQPQRRCLSWRRSYRCNSCSTCRMSSTTRYRPHGTSLVQCSPHMGKCQPRSTSERLQLHWIPFPTTMRLSYTPIAISETNLVPTLTGHQHGDEVNPLLQWHGHLPTDIRVSDSARAHEAKPKRRLSPHTRRTVSPSGG